MVKDKLNYSELKAGLELPEVKSDPISRVQLVDYASASGDYNLLHYDESFAKKSGLNGCIVHGMLQMAIGGSFILNWARGGELSSYKIRYLSPAKENDILTFTGKIVKKYQENSENLIDITFTSKNQEETITAQGSAVVLFKN
jgi:acyl dehydratase